MKVKILRESEQSNKNRLQRKQKYNMLLLDKT